MNCAQCDTPNDTDALFCANCGSAMSTTPRKRSRPWLYALVLVPVLAAAAGIGYYKFILPNGVAAEVNGEAISRDELDVLVKANGSMSGVPPEMQGRVRYAALSELITERIALQEARNAGVQLSEAEVQAAMDSMRAASGLDEKEFDARVIERYGSRKAYRKGLELRLVLRKFVDEKVTVGARDAADANDRMNRWLQGATAKATVRIALEEELPSSGGCGCCGGGQAAAKPGCDPKAAAVKGCDPAKGCGSKAGPAAGARQTPAQLEAARGAALAYWQTRNGTAPVETKVTDFGCHVQVDIMANKKVAQSLRYQNGTITEM